MSNGIASGVPPAGGGVCCASADELINATTQAARPKETMDRMVVLPVEFYSVQDGPCHPDAVSYSSLGTAAILWRCLSIWHCSKALAPLFCNPTSLRLFLIEKAAAPSSEMRTGTAGATR